MDESYRIRSAMVPRVALALLLATALRGCITYEYEHEFWLRWTARARSTSTGRPGLWTAFKGLPLDENDPRRDEEGGDRELFERLRARGPAGHGHARRGHRYLFVSADFKDVNRISYTPAFPDLRVGLRREAGRLHARRQLAAAARGPGRRGRPTATG